jgi:hypothetical protein
MNADDMMKALEESRAASELARAQVQDLALRMAELEAEGSGPATVGENWMLQTHLGNSGGTDAATGFWIYRRNGAAVESLSWADVLALWDPENAGADNFNLKFGVTSGVLDAVSLAGSTSTSYGNTGLYDGNAFAEPSAILQSFYLIPIRRSGQWICRGGVFRENRFCTDKGLITELVRIG